jgi:hypothetical protein
MFMTLSTPSSSVPTASRVNIADNDICAGLCAAAAGVHVALVVPRAHESMRVAVAFLLVTVALVVASLAEALGPTPVGSAAVATLLLAVATAYLLSRTAGIPGLIEHPEPFDPVGVVISCLELVAAVLAVRQINPRRH